LPNILAIDLHQIARAKDCARIAAVMAREVENRQPVIVADYRLTVDDVGSVDASVLFAAPLWLPLAKLRLWPAKEPPKPFLRAKAASNSSVHPPLQNWPNRRLSESHTKAINFHTTGSAPGPLEKAGCLDMHQGPSAKGQSERTRCKILSGLRHR
jgi:hypothetical protein